MVNLPSGAFVQGADSFFQHFPQVITMIVGKDSKKCYMLAAAVKSESKDVFDAL